MWWACGGAIKIGKGMSQREKQLNIKNKKCGNFILFKNSFLNYKGTPAYERLEKIVLKTSLLNDIKQLCPDAETSCLEGFHSTLNQWHPKMKCFSWLGTYCRYM